MPCFRCGTTLERALTSVAAQTVPPAEVIMVDDASDDDTPARIAQLAGRTWPFAVKAIRLPVNVGPGEARNAGWAAADVGCEFVAFLDADDEWLPIKLERQVAWLRAHSEFAWSAQWCGWEEDRPEPNLSLFAAHKAGAARRGAVGPRARCEGEKERTGKGFSELTRDRLLWRNPVATPTVMVRREVAVRFRSGWRHCEDFMLWQDLFAAGHRGSLLEETLVRLGRRPTTRGGLTGDLTAMHAGELRVLDALRSEGRLSAFTAIGWRTWMKAKYLRRTLKR